MTREVASTELPFCVRTAPIPVGLTSISDSVSNEGSNYASVVSFDNALCSLFKNFWCSSFQFHRTSFIVRSREGLAESAKSGTNCPQKVTSLRRFLTLCLILERRYFGLHLNLSRVGWGTTLGLNYCETCFLLLVNHRNTRTFLTA